RGALQLGLAFCLHAGHDLVRRRALREHQEAFEEQLRHGRQRGQIFEWRFVDYLEQSAPAVEQTQDTVQLVGNFVEALDQLVMIDLENTVERGQLLEQATPFVQAPHALHQQPLRRRGYDVGALDRAKFDLEAAGRPDQRSIHRLFAPQAAEL